MRSSLLVIVAAGLFARAGSAAAEESIAAGIKVISEKNPDASCVETVLESIIKPGMTDQQKAEAVFDYLVRHLYHHHSPEEPNADGLKNRKYHSENTEVMDTIKQLNVYSFGLCGMQSRFQNHLWNAAGLFGRVNGVTGHTTPEVKYGGKWHYLDVDMMGFVRRPDGTIPSIDEIKADRSLLFNKHARQPAIFFKYDGPNTMWNCLKNGVRFSMYGRRYGVHSMNLTLREGESITRYFRRQWGPKYRYYCPPWKESTYAKRLRSKYNREGAGYGGPSRGQTYYLCKEKGAARFGNFELIYDPPLKKRSSLAGAYRTENVTHSAASPFLRPKEAGEAAEVVYKFYSPYGCAGCPNDLQSPDDDTDGAVIEGAFATGDGSVAYSLDLGRSWKEAHKGGGKFELDLTTKLQGHYCWLVKLSFKGAGSGVKSLRSCVSGQLSPASLPFVDGRTKMTFTREDTECVLFAPDVTASESEFKRLAHDVERFVKFEEGISGHIIFQGHEGSVTYKVDVPGEIVRVQAAAKIGCRRGGTKNSVLFSVDGGKTWILACRQRIVQDEDHNEEQWTQCIEGILDFERKKAYSPACTPGGGSVRESDFEPKATKSVLVKFDTRGGNGKLVQVPGIYVLYRKPGSLPLTITHRWDGGDHVEKIGAGEKKKTYTVNGGPLGSNDLVRIEAR